MRTSRTLAAAVLVAASAASTASAFATTHYPGGDAVRPSVHSSDGMRGPDLGRVLAGSVRSEAPPSGRQAAAQTWRVSPGLRMTDLTSVFPQGQVQVHVLTARWRRAGLVLDQVSGPTVASRAPLSQLLAADRGLAGVNADFFDINDTGAPLGVGVDRDRRLLHAPRAGWTSTFYLDRRGTPRIGQVSLSGRVVRDGQTALTLGGLNLPHVAPDAVNAYTSAWGPAVDEHVVDGATRVRVVEIWGDVVRSNRRVLGFTSDLATGTTLVGRGVGATDLLGLKVGQRVRVINTLSARDPLVAVGGSAQLLRAGRVVTDDNGELHPRTAVGIDRDAGLLHLVVVDGRSESSSGVTLLQLADLMRSLGDEAALNLDGGGSSTMVAPDPDGVMGVRNAPSDGQERAVANGLEFRYTPPAG